MNQLLESFGGTFIDYTVSGQERKITCLAVQLVFLLTVHSKIFFKAGFGKFTFHGCYVTLVFILTLTRTYDRCFVHNL